jgi:pilus assembly protein CpaF
MTNDADDNNQKANNVSDDADDAKSEERERPIPRFTDPVESLPGRWVTTAGIIERITEQFIAEYGYDPAGYRDMDDEAERRARVRDVAEYIFSVESMHLDSASRARLIRRAHDEIFGYGTLDTFFSDERVTTIAIEGSEKVAIRYGVGQELQPHDPIFDDLHHLQRLMKRLLQDADAELRDDTPIIEVGLRVQKRPVCISIVAPPLTPELTADIRVHPVQPPTLADLAQQGFLPKPLDELLSALIQSQHGFIIVGDTESGKTTFLNAILQALPTDQSLIAVERAGEMQLPEHAQSLTVKWQRGQREGTTFGQQIENALQQQPNVLALDEVRADEATALQPLLTSDDVPRLIWSFRGGAMPKRIRSALSQVARMAYPAQPEGAVHALYRRLPFVVILRRRRGSIQVRSIAEWQWDETGEYANLVNLASVVDGEIEVHGVTPQNNVDLPADFWQK